MKNTNLKLSYIVAILLTIAVASCRQNDTENVSTPEPVGNKISANLFSDSSDSLVVENQNNSQSLSELLSDEDPKIPPRK